jgi:hypothetical protein
MYYPLNTSVVVRYRNSVDDFNVIRTTDVIVLNQTYTYNNTLIPSYVDGPLQKVNRQQTESKLSNNPFMIMDEVEHAKMSSLMNAKIQDKIGSK